MKASLWLGQAHKTGQKHFKGKQDSGLGQECKAGQEWFNWNQDSGLGQTNEAGPNQTEMWYKHKYLFYIFQSLFDIVNNWVNYYLVQM